MASLLGNDSLNNDSPHKIWVRLCESEHIWFQTVYSRAGQTIMLQAESFNDWEGAGM